jgi:chromate reductase, NAD(P)H dehydrogenase (quinone)
MAGEWWFYCLLDMDHLDISKQKSNLTMSLSAATKTTAAAALRCVVFMGSARQKPTSWNPDDTGRLGDRVLAFAQSRVAAHNAQAGNPQLSLEVFDPAAIPEMQQVMQSPMYFLPTDEVPDKIKDMCRVIEEADCFLVVTPEHNHTIPSSLTNMMNHFGCSKYAKKVSGCVCYSMTPTGGPRVAQALRPYLSELGCLPVSKQVIFSNAYGLFDQKGVPREGQTAGGMRPQSIADHVNSQMDGLLKDVIWWAAAARSQRGS